MSAQKTTMLLKNDKAFNLLILQQKFALMLIKTQLYFALFRNKKSINKSESQIYYTKLRSQRFAKSGKTTCSVHVFVTAELFR